LSVAGPDSAASRDGLHVATRDRVIYVTLDRPAALNAISDAMVEELDRVLTEVEADQTIRALVLTGRGEVFCVGMDLACLDRGFRDHAYFRRFLERLNTVLLRMEALPVPVIAAVNGLARAGGFEMILASDLAIAADEARIGDNHTQFGVMPGGGATQRAPRRVGAQRARELILTARWLDGRGAAEYGLVLRSVPRAELTAAVEELVGQFRNKSRACLAAAKAAMNDGASLGIADGIRLEIDRFFTYLEQSPDATEGFTAYREKRSPRWSTDP
jgi:enoyl-CoA hydratase/carnithine racemase